MTQKDQILGQLRAENVGVKTGFKVRSMSLFGSMARNEAGPGSDIDILVDFEPGVGLFELVRLGNYLQERLGAKIDLVPKSALRAELRDRVLAEAVLV